MPYSAEAFRRMAMLHDRLDSREPAAIVAALRETIEPLGVRYFHMSQGIAAASGAGPRVASVVDTAPTLVMLNQLRTRHRKFDEWAEQLLRDARAFDTDSTQIDVLPEEFQRMVDEQRQIGGANYYISTPLFAGENCVGLSTYFFERRADEPDDLIPLLNVLSQSVFDQLREGTSLPAVSACSLTPRQREALQYCAAGKSDWDIGVLMNVATATAHEHIEAAKRRLGVKTRIQAVLLAYKKGWIGV